MEFAARHDASTDQGFASDMDPREVEKALAADGTVQTVHHLYLRNLASGRLRSTDVILGEEKGLHQAQGEVERLKSMLHDRFGIEHATLELECYLCAPSDEHEEASDGHDHDGLVPHEHARASTYTPADQHDHLGVKGIGQLRSLASTCDVLSAPPTT